MRGVAAARGAVACACAHGRRVRPRGRHTRWRRPGEQARNSSRNSARWRMLFRLRTDVVPARAHSSGRTQQQANRRQAAGGRKRQQAAAGQMRRGPHYRKKYAHACSAFSPAASTHRRAPLRVAPLPPQRRPLLWPQRGTAEADVAADRALGVHHAMRVDIRLAHGTRSPFATGGQVRPAEARGARGGRGLAHAHAHAHVKQAGSTCRGGRIGPAGGHLHDDGGERDGLGGVLGLQVLHGVARLAAGKGHDAARGMVFYEQRRGRRDAR